MARTAGARWIRFAEVRELALAPLPNLFFRGEVGDAAPLDRISDLELV